MMPNQDSVEYDIILKAAQALTELQKLNAQATSFNQKVTNVTSTLKTFSSQTGLSIKSTVSLFKDADEAFAAINNKSALFGDLQKQGWTEVHRGVDGFGKKSKSAFEQAISGVNAFRIALGAVISMLLFQGIQAVSNFFRGAIDQARQFEETLYRIANAERQLSMEGIEVSVAGLKKGIEDIQNALPIFSKEDVAELIGSLATTTKELGYSGEEIIKLGAAIAILNINSTETETLLQTQAKVTNSLISPQAKSIGNLGLSFGKAKMEAKAFEMQILQTGESFADLTEKEKTEIKYQIVLETAGIEGVDDIEKLRDMIKEAGGDFAALDAYLKSNAARLHENKAAWKDFQTTVGQALLPFIPALTDFIKLMVDGVNGIKVLTIEASLLLLVWANLFKSIATFKGIPDMEDQVAGVKKLRETLVNEFFKEVPEDAPQWFMKGWGNLIKEQAETATGPVQDLAEAIEELDSDALRNKIEDIIEDTANAREDLEESLSRKLEDLDTEYARKAEEAAIDLQRKLEDIDRDYAREKTELLSKQRREDEKAEAEYQLRLWELRMRFLMDLEDALHARDARQVIRLQKQYNIDKEALARKHALEENERHQSQKAELENLEAKRRERIEDAQREYEQKLIDQQIAKQRELDDLNLWYAREQADIELAQQRKLETLLKGWIDEQKITAENAAEVYAILREYFGPGGLTDQLYQYMMQSLVANTVGAINQGMAAAAGSLNALYGLANNVNPFQGNFALPSTGNTSPTGGTVGHRSDGFAEGGTLLATRPTRALFGEGGPELVNFTPLSRIGKNVNKIFGDRSGGGVNGQIRVLVDLSPDLEGRIVEQSMDGVADVISKVGRMK